MEAVRPREVVADHNFDEDDQTELPPPPAPFPLDQIPVDARQTAEQLHSGTSTASSLNISQIQQNCIHALSLLIPDSPTSSSAPLPKLSSTDSRLAGALTDLLDVSYELESMQTTLTARPDAKGTISSITDLVRSMELLQKDVESRRSKGEIGLGLSGTEIHPAIGVVREELAWTRIDVLTGLIVELVNVRQQETVAECGSIPDDKPPEYDFNEQSTLPPSYQPGPTTRNRSSSPSTMDKEIDRSENMEKRLSQPAITSSIDAQSRASASREKLLRDLEDVTTAIERLQELTPRLDAQRSELRPPTLSKAEIQARMHRDKMREMEEIWRLIERTNGGRRKDKQRVDIQETEVRRRERRRRFFEDLIESSENSRMENQDAVMSLKIDAALAKARDLRERDLLLKQLMKNGDEGRLSDQDASFTRDDGAKVQAKRQALMDRLVDYSSSGRLENQDSEAPTPRAIYHTANGNMSSELVTMRDFFMDPQTLPKTSSTERSPSESDQARLRSDSLTNEGESSEQGRKSGTLKKIAGLVRRKSIGFSLKSPVIGDASSLSYVAEHQENLKSVMIMLHGSGLSLKDDLYIETALSVQPGCGVKEAEILSRRDTSLSLKVELPVAVPVGQTVNLQQSDLHLEAKLSALPTQSAASFSALTSLAHPLSAPELRKLRPKALCCTMCDREVADLSKASRSEDAEEGSGFKDLPSEHWAEMLEVWMCHDDPAFTAKVARQTNEGFWPTRENVLVGGSYLLVHPEEAKSKNLQLEKENSEAWSVVSCLCGHDLGKKRGKEQKYGTGTVKFSKWAVALLGDGEDGEFLEPIRFPITVFVLSDLLELAQAHATFRFNIQDEMSHETRLLMWLFNPSTSISYKSPSIPPLPSPKISSNGHSRPGSGHGRTSDRPVPSRRGSGLVNVKGTAKTMKAAKVIYKVVDEPLTSDFMPGWGNINGGQVETITYPSQVIEAIINALKESTAVYPPARREMNKLKIGFLERF